SVAGPRHGGRGQRLSLLLAHGAVVGRALAERAARGLGQPEDADGVASLLKLLMPRAESPALEELPLTARQWVRHLKRDDEGDGTFLVRRFADASMDERWREDVFDSLDVPFVLAPARGMPSRTTSF